MPREALVRAREFGDPRLMEELGAGPVPHVHELRQAAPNYTAGSRKLGCTAVSRYVYGMIGWLLRGTVSLVVLGLCAYAVVALPIGRRTLLEHGLKIAKTKPAQELVEDVGSAASAAVDRARTALK